MAYLNIIDYFVLFVNNKVYTYYNFAVTFGGLLAFLISPYIFKKFNTYTTMYICFLSSSSLFYLHIFLV